MANSYKFDGVFFAFFLKGQWRYDETEWERERETGSGKVHEAGIELGTLQHARDKLPMRLSAPILLAFIQFPLNG